MSVYDEITQAIVAELEKGVPPWVKSWSSQLPMNVVSQKGSLIVSVEIPICCSDGGFA
jgi:antirestriction protein ArdC